MAQVIYEAIQKPLEKRLEEAACIYYGVEREFFCQKKKDEYTDKRRVLFLLLNMDCEFNPTTIAHLYGHTQSGIFQALDLIKFRESYCLWIRNDMKQIRNIAANLAAKLIVMDVKLEHFLATPPVPLQESK